MCTINISLLQQDSYTIRVIKRHFVQQSDEYHSSIRCAQYGEYCFLFPLGAVLMRGNAGALAERCNEVRSAEAAVIRDGLNTLRGGELL